MTVRRLTGASVLLLVATACSGSSKAGHTATESDAGTPAASAEPVVAHGRCEPSPRTPGQAYCTDTASSIVVRGDGEDATLNVPDAASGEPYVHSFDNTCGDGLWTLNACKSAREFPCVWISYRGKDGGLCGEYQDRAGTLWQLTALTGEPVVRPRTEPPYSDHVVTGELVADFETPEGDTLRLTLELDACGPDYSHCCLC